MRHHHHHHRPYRRAADCDGFASAVRIIVAALVFLLYCWVTKGGRK